MLTADQIEGWESLGEKHHLSMMRTLDPKHEFQGHPLPALTTLLHTICGNHPDKFDEATRLVALFMEQAVQDNKGT